MKATIRVLNVRHGDCISVVLDGESGESYSMVIDGGGQLPDVDIVDLLSRRGGLPIGTDGKPRIDLLVASHRDEDHLAGLVRIVESDAFEIGRAWAPIILKPNFDPLYATRSLTGVTTFTEAAMSDSKQALNATLDDMESALMRRLPAPCRDLISTPEAVFNHAVPMTRSRAALGPGDTRLLKTMDTAKHPLLTGLVTLGDSLERHSSGFVPLDQLTKGWLGATKGEASRIFAHVGGLHGRLRDTSSHSLAPTPEDAKDYMTLLSRSAARAVSWVTRATWFIQACRDRKIKIDMPMVADSRASKGNLPGAPGFDGVEMLLLSPTKGLVASYASDLALPEGAGLLMRAIHTVTSANKPSYVFSLRVLDDMALFTGDSGFNDFILPGAKEFKEERLALAAAAFWVKVPHHAGSYEYFDRCITHSAEQGGLSSRIFVASLGPDGTSHHTPNQDYEAFALDLREKLETAPQFHFTNRPMRDRFAEICPDCDQDGAGIGPEYLEYTNRGGNRWKLVNQSELICCKNTL